MTRQYWDCNASCPVLPSVQECVINVLDLYGNPSALHKEGQQAARLRERIRTDWLTYLGGDFQTLIWGGSATEINNLLMKGRSWPHIFVVNGDHPSLLKPAMKQNHYSFLPLDPQGRICLDSLEAMLKKHDQPGFLCSLSLAHGETGIIQYLPAMAELVKKAGGFLHLDAVQALGRVQMIDYLMDVDFLTLGFHKVGGLRGAACLISRQKNPSLRPLIDGGGQEWGYRSGTEQMIAIAASGALYEWLKQEESTIQERMRTIQMALESDLSCQIIGQNSPRLPNTTAIAMAEKDGQEMVVTLDLMGIAASAGAACASGSVRKSVILEQMGLPHLSGRMVRFSWGWPHTIDDVPGLLQALAIL